MQDGLNEAFRIWSEDGKCVRLSPLEFRIIRRVKSRKPLCQWDDLIMGAYDGRDEPENAKGVINITLFRLRKKLQKSGVRYPLVSHPGIGIEFRPPT